MNIRNNHASCWIATASSMAKLTDDQGILDMFRNRFKTILLPEQMALDGSFPAELKGTKPYAYSLFNMDAFANIAQILSTEEDNLWEFSTSDGKGIKKGMDFIFPFIKSKELWPYKKDVFNWEKRPTRQSCLLFAGLAYQKQAYIDTYMEMEEPSHPEVLRNLSVGTPSCYLAQYIVEYFSDDRNCKHKKTASLEIHKRKNEDKNKSI